METQVNSMKIPWTSIRIPLKTPMKSPLFHLTFALCPLNFPQLSVQRPGSDPSSAPQGSCSAGGSNSPKCPPPSLEFLWDFSWDFKGRLGCPSQVLREHWNRWDLRKVYKSWLLGGSMMIDLGEFVALWRYNEGQNRHFMGISWGYSEEFIVVPQVVS